MHFSMTEDIFLLPFDTGSIFRHPRDISKPSSGSGSGTGAGSGAGAFSGASSSSFSSSSGTKVAPGPGGRSRDAPSLLLSTILPLLFFSTTPVLLVHQLLILLYFSINGLWVLNKESLNLHSFYFYTLCNYYFNHAFFYLLTWRLFRQILYKLKVLVETNTTFSSDARFFW